LLNLNNTTDLFPRVSYQLSSFRRETGMLLPHSERKKKKSCNKNSIKNTVPEIETGRHVKNNVCTVEIKIKWMLWKHMTYENTYRDDTCTLLIYFSNISVFFIEFLLQLFFFFLSPFVKKSMSSRFSRFSTRPTPAWRNVLHHLKLR
jgi:hypothetical protein